MHLNSHRQQVLTADEKPAYSIHPSGVAQSLRNAQRWICWEWVRIDGRWTKVPKQASDPSRNASSTDPATWSDFDTAVASASSYGLGLGYVLADDGIIGIDLDDCRNPSTGDIAGWAQDILDHVKSYAEVSPSLTGVKIFVRGQLPDGIRKKHPRPEGGEIELYSTGRFFTVTGQRVFGSPDDVRDCQTGINCLLMMVESWRPQQPCIVTPVATTHDLDRDAQVNRARSYLAQVPGAVSGSGGHNHTFVTAKKLAGFGVNRDDAFALLSEWNLKCEPPWSERELSHKIDSAFKSGAYPMPDRSQNQFAGPPVDISKIMGEPVTSTPVVAVSSEPRLPVFDVTALTDDFYSIPGIIGEMVAFNRQFAPRPQPGLALLASIALVGAITGRKIQSPSGLRTNVYCIGLSPSGGGKDQPRIDNVKVFTQAGCPQFLSAENPASDAALIGELEENPALLMQIDEAAKYFTTMRTSGGNSSSHMKDMNKRILELTGAAGNPIWTPKAWSNKDRKKPIAYPHLCIYGVSTIDGFWDCVTSTDVSDGFLARMMVLETSSEYPRLRLIKSPPIPQTVIDAVKDWAKFTPPGGGDISHVWPEPFAVPADDDAWGRLIEHSEGIEDRLKKDNPEIRPIWARCSALANKLALIFAASRGPSNLKITLADADAGIRQANWCARLTVKRVFTSIADNEDEKRKKRLLGIVANAGEITATELTRKSQWIKDARTRRDILEELIQGGFIASRQLPASKDGGVGAIVYSVA